MLVHRRERREAETAPDFLEARRIAVLLDEFVQVIEDFALPLGQGKHCLASRIVSCDPLVGTIRKRKAKVNGVVSVAPVSSLPRFEADLGCC